MFDNLRRIAKAILPQSGFYRYPEPRQSQLLNLELGRSGLRRFYPGWIADELLPELQGHRRYLVLREMADMNAFCAAALNGFSMFLRRSHWTVDPVEDENETNGSAQFLREAMSDLEHSFETFIAQASRFVPQYGFGVWELCYKRREGEKEDERYSSKFNDGAIGWQGFAIRSPPTILHWVWYPDDPNRLAGLVQLTPPDYPPNLFIPTSKLLILRAEPGEDNPEGRSILRSSYKPFITIKYLEDARNVIIERGGTGIPYADVPPNIANPYKIDAAGNTVVDDQGNPVVDAGALATLTSIIETLKSLRVSKEPYMVRPQMYDEKGNKLFDMGFLTNNGGAMIGDINTTIHEEGLKILMSTMTEFLALGTNATGGGSFALSKDKTDNFTLAITSYLDAFENSINNQAVPRLFKLNPQFKCKVLPRIVHDDIVPLDMREIAQFLGIFKNIGWDISEDEKIRDFVLDKMGLPKSTRGKVAAAIQQQPKAPQVPEPKEEPAPPVKPLEKPKESKQPKEEKASVAV